MIGQSTRPKVVVVDDDELQLDLVARQLKLEGFDVLTSPTPFGATNLIAQVAPRVVLLDLNFPTLSGDQLLVLCKKRAPKTTLFVLYSAADESTLRELARSSGANGWISKSSAASELGSRLRALMENHPA